MKSQGCGQVTCLEEMQAVCAHADRGFSSILAMGFQRSITIFSSTLAMGFQKSLSLVFYSYVEEALLPISLLSNHLRLECRKGQGK